MHANTLPERRFCFHIKNDVTVNLGQLKPQIGKSNKQNKTQSIVLSSKGRCLIWDYFIKSLKTPCSSWELKKWPLLKNEPGELPEL